MLKALVDFLLNRKGHPVQKDSTIDAQAPYKVEAPGAVNAIAEPAKCGCGRSPTGNCVGLHKLTEAEWAVHPDNKKPDANWPFPTPVGTEVKKPAVKAKAARAKKAPVPAIKRSEEHTSELQSH